MADYILPFILCCISLTRVTLGNDDHGVNAVSYDSDTFATGVKESRNFVMFYAPWCGHCKNLAPTWDELAKIYNKEEGSPVVIAKIDCTVHTALCSDHEVVGFPTLKLFDVGGDNHKRYSGKRDLESLKAFIQENPDGEAAQAEESFQQPQVPEPKSGLIVLTDDNFTDRVKKGSFFVKFYAPWCGHCQKLAPVWEDLADTYNHLNDVNIAKIDCTQSTVICKKYEIGGYPTLMWFNNGQKADLYQGSRSHEALKKYTSDRLLAFTKEVHRQDEKETIEAGEDSEPVDFVKDLTDETFKSEIASGLHFVKFFAPWCGHCKRLAPTWEDLAKDFHSIPRLSIARVDCTQYKATCEDNQVRGYPTLKLFNNGEYLKDYKGARSLEELHEFVKIHLEGVRDEL